MIVALAFIALMALLVLVVFFANKKGCDEAVHRFEPRYSEESTPPPLNLLSGFRGTVYGAEMTLEAYTARKKTYIHDVCTRCGKIVYTTPPVAGPAPSAEMIRDSLRKAGEEFVKKMSP